MNDLKEWLQEARELLASKTGRTDIEVTGGPYRGADVSIREAPDGHPIVDLYSFIRRDPWREREAMLYAIGLLKDWEATKAAHRAEMRAVFPFFYRLLQMFPKLPMEYHVTFADVHKVRAARDPKTGEVKVDFDLWPGMREADIQRLAGYIKDLSEAVAAPGGPEQAGMDYWPGGGAPWAFRVFKAE